MIQTKTKFLIAAVAVIAGSICLPVRVESATGRPAKSLVLSIQCPDSITVAMKAVPSGWDPFIFPGAAIQKFSAAAAEQEGPDTIVACYFDNAKSVGAPYVLTRKLPGHYRCKVNYSLVSCMPVTRIN